MQNDSTGNFKTCKVGLFEELDDNMLVIRPSRNGFNPFEDIVNNNENVLKAVGMGKGPMKSMPQTLKISTIKIGVRGISSRQDKRPKF